MLGAAVETFNQISCSVLNQLIPLDTGVVSAAAAATKDATQKTIKNISSIVMPKYPFA